MKNIVEKEKKIMIKEKHIEISNSIQGWMDDTLLSILYDTAINKELVVEIGCWKGKTTAVLAVAKKVICIDSWAYQLKKENDIYFEVYCEYAKDADILEEFKKNVSIFDNIAIIVGKSCEVSNQVLDNSADLIVIDGDHSYESVKKDLELYFPKLNNTGIIFCHDYGYPDITNAVNEFAKTKQLNIVELDFSGIFLERK